MTETLITTPTPNSTDNIRAQRLRIIREVEAAALHDTTGKLPWRPSWAAYFGGRAGLLDALATRRQCLALIDVSTLPDAETREMVARRLQRTNAGLERILRRYGQLEAA
jgi:hypothetical protein